MGCPTGTKTDPQLYDLGQRLRVDYSSESDQG